MKLLAQSAAPYVVAPLIAACFAGAGVTFSLATLHPVRLGSGGDRGDRSHSARYKIGCNRLVMATRSKLEFERRDKPNYQALSAERNCPQPGP